MVNQHLKQKVLEKLNSIYKSKGYITIDEVIQYIDEAALPLDEVERLCDILTNNGVIIRDEPTNIAEDDDENIFDRSKLDYDKLFERVIEIDPSLEPYIDGVKSILPPQYREEAALIYQAKEGNPYAKERLITMNLRIVVKMALSFYERYDFPLADSLQYGNMGLVMALKKMPLTPDGRFSTYAPWWIRQIIFRYLYIGNNIQYIPVHMKEKLYKVYEIKKEHYCDKCNGLLCQQLIDIVSEKCEMDSETAIKCLILIEAPYSVEELTEKESDNSIFNDNGYYEYFIAEYITEKELKTVIQGLLSDLKERERRVLTYRFGLNGEDPMTLEEVGAIFGLTRERIRQIESKAIKRLRHPSRSKLLKDYNC